MSAVRLAWTELRRLTATRAALVTLAALLLVPTLYGSMYLYANHDPYGSLDKVPAAVVVEDTGAVQSGRAVHAGQDLADRLLADGSFDWQQVDAATAKAGIASGRYDFAVTIPAGFSTALTTVGTSTPQQATLQLMTDDATNYIARTIATQAVEKVRAQVARQVGEQAASQFLVGLSTISSNLGDAADGASRLADDATSAQTGARDLASGASSLAQGTTSLASGATQVSSGAASAAKGAAQLSTGATALSDGLATLTARTADLPAQTSSLASGAASVSAGAASLQSGTADLETGSAQVTAGLSALQQQLQAQLTAAGVPAAQVQAIVAQVGALHSGSQQVTSGLGRASTGATALASGASQVSDGASALATAAVPLRDGIVSAYAGAQRVADGASALASGTSTLADGASTLADGAQSAATGASALADGSARLSQGVSSLASGAGTLSTSLADGAGQVPVVPAADRAAAASGIADPVGVTTTSTAKAATYGSGLAPFFLALALWIGGYVLFLLVRPLSRRALAADQKPWHVSLGGWLTPALFGVVQAALVAAVVSWGVGIVPANAVGTVAFMALVSVTFIAILHALNAWFGPVGQFLGLILMILQLVSGGGTFPWQTLPEPLWPLHQVLPMSYAISGLRQVFYAGGGSVLSQSLVLVGYLVAALALTTLAARRQRTWTPSRLQPAVVL
ncbi:MAG: YhgE/Pip domain-containing protein [Candidatus Nanopelagicales bacterium]